MNASTTMGPPEGSGITPHQQGLIAAAVLLIVLAVSSVVLRVYTRRWILGVTGTEDYLICIALLFSVGASICAIHQTIIALGPQAMDLSNSSILMEFTKVEWATFIFYGLSMTCTKLSIFFLYLRILQHTWLRRANFVLIFIVAIFGFWAVFSEFIMCIPLEALWNPAVEGRCLPYMTLGLINSILGIITDFATFLLPLPVITQLRLPRGQKIALLAIFSLGLFVCIVSIIRVVNLSTIDFDDDFAYCLAVTAYWGASEVSLATICACLSTLHPLLKRLMPRLFRSEDDGQGQVTTIGRQGRNANVLGSVSLGSQPRDTDEQSRSPLKPEEGSEQRLTTPDDVPRRSFTGDNGEIALQGVDVAVPEKTV